MRDTERTDIFLWANNVDAHRSDLKVELFVFSKNGIVYRLKHDEFLEPRFRGIFLYDHITAVQKGAAVGMKVLDYVDSIGTEGSLAAIQTEEVPYAQTLLEQLEYGEEQLDLFDNDEHEFRRIKGIVARYTGDNVEPFYVFKRLQQSTVLNQTDFLLENNTVTEMRAQKAFRLDANNHVLVVGNTIFAFHKQRFEDLFDHSPEMLVAARNNGAAIDETYGISTASVGQGFEFMVKDEKSLLKRLATLDFKNNTREDFDKVMDEFDTNLMTDDNGKIIVMDKNDAKVVMDIIEDNFVHGATGVPYIAKNKKVFVEDETV